MKIRTDNPKPRGFQGTDREFEICSQQEGHTVHGVPNLSDDQSSNRWDASDDDD